MVEYGKDSRMKDLEEFSGHALGFENPSLPNRLHPHLTPRGALSEKHIHNGKYNKCFRHSLPRYFYLKKKLRYNYYKCCTRCTPSADPSHDGSNEIQPNGHKVSYIRGIKDKSVIDQARGIFDGSNLSCEPMSIVVPEGQKTAEIEMSEMFENITIREER